MNKFDAFNKDKKFNIGDTVRVKKDLVVGETYYTNNDKRKGEIFTYVMADSRGRVAKIIERTYKGYKLSSVRDIDTIFTYTDEMLELYDEETMKREDRSKERVNHPINISNSSIDKVLTQLIIEGHMKQIDDALKKDMHIKNPEKFKEIFDSYKRAVDNS